MPDITMCSGQQCSLQNDCYRHRAPPSEYLQSYFVTPPYKDGRCEYFLSIDGYERLQPVRRYQYAVLGRDGDTVHVSDELYDTESEAYEAGNFWEDDPRYGSHEVEIVDDVA